MSVILIMFYTPTLILYSCNVYLGIHDENHWHSSVYIGYSKFIRHWIPPIEVKLDKLPVAVGAIHNTPVDSVKERENRFQGFPPSLNIFI